MVLEGKVGQLNKNQYKVVTPLHTISPLKNKLLKSKSVWCNISFEDLCEEEIWNPKSAQRTAEMNKPGKSTTASALCHALKTEKQARFPGAVVISD